MTIKSWKWKFCNFWEFSLVTIHVRIRLMQIPISINIFRSAYFHHGCPDNKSFRDWLLENWLYFFKRIRNRKSCIHFFATILRLVKYSLPKGMSFLGSKMRCPIPWVQFKDFEFFPFIFKIAWVFYSSSE